MCLIKRSIGVSSSDHSQLADATTTTRRDVAATLTNPHTGVLPTSRHHIPQILFAQPLSFLQDWMKFHAAGGSTALSLETRKIRKVHCILKSRKKQFSSCLLCTVFSLHRVQIIESRSNLHVGKIKSKNNYKTANRQTEEVEDINVYL